MNDFCIIDERILKNIKINIGLMIYWKNNGSIYKAKIIGYYFKDEENYIICESFPKFNDEVYKFRLSDYNKIWFDRYNIYKLIDEHNIFNYCVDEYDDNVQAMIKQDCTQKKD